MTANIFYLNGAAKYENVWTKFYPNKDKDMQKLIPQFLDFAREKQGLFYYPLDEVPPFENFSSTIERIKNIEQIIKKEFQLSLSEEQMRMGAARKLIEKE